VGPTGIGVLHGREDLLEQMQPFLTGGDMIASVDFQETTWNELPYKFEAGTPPISEAVGLGAAVHYLSALGMENVRAHEQALTAYMLERLAEVPGLRVVGPPAADRGHPPPRHRGAGGSRRRVHPCGAPLRAAADALPGCGRHGAGERGRVQRPRGHRCADRRAASRARGLRALEPLSKRSARPDASLDTALDRHVPAWPCYRHGLHRPATPSLVHERPDRTAYFESGS
jgi:Aminotransferase class-V